MSELKENKCIYCENPSGPSCNSPMDCWPYEAQIIGREIRIQTTDDQTVNICTIRGIKLCPMCGRKLAEGK